MEWAELPAAVADATGASCDVPGAIAALDAAAARADDADDACRALTRAAVLQLHAAGDVHQAALRLEQARRTRPHPGGDAWTRCALAGVDLRLAQGDRDGAARLAARVLDELTLAGRGAREHVIAAVHGLAAAEEPFLRRLCTELAHVYPDERLALLDGIERCPTLTHALRTELRRLVPATARSLRDAELDRVVGRSDRARETLAAIADEAPPHALVAAAARANAGELLLRLERRALPPASPWTAASTLVAAAGAVPDPRLRARLLEAASVLTPAALPAQPVAEQELRVTLQLRAGRLSVVTKRHDGEAGLLRGTAASKRIAALLDAPSAEALAARVHADPAGLGRDLAALLRAAAGAERLDVGLRAQHPAVRALPWELAAPELEADGLRLFRRTARMHGAAADVRALQRALGVFADGAFGPLTRTALKSFQAAHGLGETGRPDPLTIQRLHAHVAGARRPRVAVIEPGDEIAHEYARAGFEPVAPGGALAVLHIRAALDLHHGSPALRLDRPLTALALDHSIARGTPSPLVVLDVPAGEDPLTQLLLRNAFAAELAAVGTVRAILAASAAPAALVEALKAGHDVYAIAAALRVPELPPALFARTPALRFPAPRSPVASEL